MRIALLVCALLLATGCSCPPASQSGTTPSGSGSGVATPPATPSAPAGAEQRTPAVAASHAQYGRVEGTSFQNACERDDQCSVGGCSSEVCSAEQGVSSTCEAPADGWPSARATCGCVSGQCIWWRAGAGLHP